MAAGHAVSRGSRSAIGELLVLQVLLEIGRVLVQEAQYFDVLLLPVDVVVLEVGDHYGDASLVHQARMTTGFLVEVVLVGGCC